MHDKFYRVTYVLDEFACDYYFNAAFLPWHQICPVTSHYFRTRTSYQASIRYLDRLINTDNAPRILRNSRM